MYFCVFYVCTGEKKKTDRHRETEGWSSVQQVEIPFSRPLLFVSTAGLGQRWAVFLGFFFSHQGFLQLYVDQQSELSTDYAYYKTLPFSQVGRYASYLLSLLPVYLTQFCRTRSTKLASASQQRVLSVAGVIAERRKGLTPRPRS